MAKAVLVMDMPESCKRCPCATEITEDGVERRRCDAPNCERLDSYVDEYDSCKPSWCPLKPVPEKREPDERYYESSYVDIGFNACIDAICGKE